VVRLSKPDLAIALLVIPTGAAVDAWLFPGGSVDPFSSGVYFCATAIGAKYAIEAARAAWRRRKRRQRLVHAQSAREVAAKKLFAPQMVAETSAPTRRQIERQLNLVIGALASEDVRAPADREKCQNYKAELIARHKAWQAGTVADEEFVKDIRWAREKYDDVITSRQHFEQVTRTRAISIDDESQT
jgi:hypothetical protein